MQIKHIDWFESDILRERASELGISELEKIPTKNLIKNGCTGVFFMGSTGQAQLCSVDSKKELISKIASHKLRKQFFIGLGVNSLSDSISLIKYANEYEINKEILIGAPAYYRNNSDQGVFNFFKRIISECPKVKIVI